jgi:hypothetical protein
MPPTLQLPIRWHRAGWFARIEAYTECLLYLQSLLLRGVDRVNIVPPLMRFKQFGKSQSVSFRVINGDVKDVAIFHTGFNNVILRTRVRGTACNSHPEGIVFLVSVFLPPNGAWRKIVSAGARCRCIVFFAQN